MELKIKNFGHASGVNVRIIKVSGDAVFENLNGQFQQMDTLGMEHGIKIPPELNITCAGASSIVGDVIVGRDATMPITRVYLNDQMIGIADDYIGMDDVLWDARTEELLVSAHFLQQWTPPGQPK